MYSTHISIFLALLVLFGSSMAFAQDISQGVAVTGTAEVRVHPDLAYVTFGVVTEAADANTAAQENARLTNAVIDAIVKSGIPRANIETVAYNVSPRVDVRRSPPVTTGYVVTNQVRVKVTDLTKIGALIDTAISAGANDVQNISFALQDESAARQQALANAVKNAQAEARVIADTLGIKLGRVISVSESGGIIPRPMEYGAARTALATTPIIPGEVEVTASVTLVYAIL